MRRTFVESLVVAALAVVAAVVLLQVWDADLGVPFSDTGDAKFYAGVTKSLDEGGWYLENPKLGAPFGSQLYDLPLGGENLQMATLKGLTLMAGWATAYNLYLLLGFPLVAAVAFVVARRFIGLSSPVAGTVALLYAFLPYHVARGEMHPLLANYAVVPLGCALVLAVARASGNAWPPTRRQTWMAIAACVVLGTTSTYYGIFTGLLLVVMGVLAGIARRDWRAPLAGAALAAVIAATFAVNLAPSLVYWARHGNHSVADRSPQESEIFGLKVSQLVLPVDDHRVDALADVSARARRDTIVPSEAGGALGAAGLVGFLVAVLIALARGLRGGNDNDTTSRLGVLGVVIIASLLLSLIGGLAFVLSLEGFRAVRGWNRMSIFIGFFALVATGHLLERALERARARPMPQWAVASVLPAVLVIGLLDQTPSRPIDYDAVAERSDADERFVTEVEARLGRGASIFQMPVVDYPEAGAREQMDDYDHLRGYLHSDSLRWSYGAIKGREGVWLERLNRLPPLTIVSGVAAAGFDGLWVDRAGFPDRASALEDAVKPYLRPVVEGGGHRRWFADLRPLARALEAALSPDALAAFRDAVLQPLAEEWRAGFYELHIANDRPARWARPEAELRVTNPGNKARRAVVRFALAGSFETVTVTWPGGSRELPRTGVGTGSQVTITFDAPPGTSTIRFSSTDEARPLPDGRPVAFLVVAPEIVDVVLLEAPAKLTTG